MLHDRGQFEGNALTEITPHDELHLLVVVLQEPPLVVPHVLPACFPADYVLHQFVFDVFQVQVVPKLLKHPKDLLIETEYLLECNNPLPPQ